MKLLIDAGNTRIKWALHDGRKFCDRGSVQHRGIPVELWSHELPARVHPTDVITANVAGEAVAQGIRDWARTTFGIRVRFPRATAAAGGVRNAYAVPNLLGVDRWLGIIGVRQKCREPFLLVSAGTAFTIDLVDAAGRHLGGLIAPGRSMMIDTLKEKTGNISAAAAAAAAAAECSVGMFALNTSGAIARGASYALAALAVQAVHEAVARCGVVRLFVHGGDAADVFELVALQASGMLPAGVESMQDAVLCGLAVLVVNGELP